ncbi:MULTISPECIES: hypothetical protein [Bacillus]|uniref:hypothetical protein n=1 Tax=Bacillus TaxID=1386 RepID=UPI000300A607|nr:MULTISPECIES: hypothetical protein [Bacillus]KML19955.1 hypothetical protein VL09_00605 [Bacillus stratosphericus]MBX7000830.1 hypothetical protein [Bacillus aerophilus]KAJ0074034.1 hypothetical protein DBB48_001205 [Bacillus altitudinis]KKK10907.1 hypothetical protein UF15_04610 [Bacillus sp. L_1B0_12]KML60204.1 hypothetical protein VL19_12215 [Bacillus stratosphericus]
MHKKQELTKQIQTVINILEKEYSQEINQGVLELIYRRYKNAQRIMQANDDLQKVFIIGGVRAYLDSHNDYLNPFLDELHKAESLLKELLY